MLRICKTILIMIIASCLAVALCSYLIRPKNSAFSEPAGFQPTTASLLTPGLTPALTPVATPAEETQPAPSATPKPALTREPAISAAAEPTKKPSPTKAPTKAPTKTPTSPPTPTSKPTATPASTSEPTEPTNLTQEPTGQADLTPSEWRAELFRLTNKERTEAGKPALSLGSSGLLQAAGIRAEEIVTDFSHTRPDGSSCFSVLEECGVTCSAKGENIAMATTGYRTPSQVMQMWMDSPGHRANILSSSFTSLGIGYCRSNGCEWFVQLFIG